MKRPEKANPWSGGVVVAQASEGVAGGWRKTVSYC